MALKLKLSKTAYEALNEAVKNEYYEKDGDYHLDVDGLEDTGGLRRAKDHEVKLRKETESKLREVTEQVATLQTEMETSETQFASELKKQLGDKEGQLVKANKFIQETLVDSVAHRLASEISIAPNLMVPHIKARLEADLSGDSPVTKIKGADGKLSDMTIDALKTELVANKDYSAIIRGNKASGSGAVRVPPSHGSAVQSNTEAPVNAAAMSPADLAASITARKAAAQTE